MEQHIELDTKISYIAGLIDGEGTVLLSLHKYKNKDSKSIYQYYKPVIRIYNTDKKMIDFCKEVFSYGFISSTKTNGRKHTIYHFSVRKKNDLHNFIDKLLPYLITKNKQAKLLLKFLDNNDTKNTEVNKLLAKEISELNSWSD